MIRKEFYKLDKTKPSIGLLMMLKNEQDHVEKSLLSVLGYVEALIIYEHR